MTLRIDVKVPPRLIEQAREQQVERRLAKVAEQRQAVVRKEAARQVALQRLAAGKDAKGNEVRGGALEDQRRRWFGAQAFARKVESVTVIYRWIDGTDLDTVTSMVRPETEDPVGFSFGSETKYLKWEGDDTGTGGSEKVTVDKEAIKKLKQEKPYKSDSKLELKLAANWWGAVGVSPITITVSVKKINQEKPDETSFKKTITLFAQGGVGQDCGSVVIDLYKGIVTIQPEGLTP